MDTNELREIAAARLQARVDLRQYLLVWAGVSALVIAIWAVTSATAGGFHYFWPVWPIVGMGIGAAVKASAAYGGTRRFVTEADIDAEVARLSR
jgi:hypothetical protein